MYYKEKETHSTDKEREYADNSIDDITMIIIL